MGHSWENKWKIGEPLGKGGQGRTYSASSIDNALQNGVLKHLNNNKDMQARSRMRREVANLQALAGSGGTVPAVLDHNTDQADNPAVELFVVMELIPGATVKAYVEKHGVLDPETAIKWILGLCDTVEKAHAFPILHRDLKPDNIIVRDERNADLVIIDYGLSFNAADEDVTQTGETFRNKFLDLPETNTPNGNLRDHRSDVTAVCAILYYCLTGCVPGHLQDAHGRAPHMRPGFSVRETQGEKRIGKFEAFFTRGFAPHIANRYQHIRELREAINDLMGSVPTDETDPVQVAASASHRLRVFHRPTQIAEFRQQAHSIFNQVTQDLQKYNGKLGRFVVAFQVERQPKMPQIPAGLDLVEHWQSIVVVIAQQHSRQYHRRLALASRGEECVLLAIDYAAESARNNREIDSHWKEVARYQGDAKPIFGIVSDSMRDWLVARIKELEQQMLSPKSA
jgi:serine/threonine protein kinase